MATKPKSYKKNGYTYTESSPGSKKYQNFTAAKPTVKKVRDESRADKAKVAATKAFPKGLADRQSTQAKSAQGLADRQPMSTQAFPKGTADRQPMTKASTGPVSRGSSVMKKSYTSREMDPTPVNVRKARPNNSYLRDKEFGKASVTEATRKSSKYKESFLRRTRRKGIIGALFGD